MADYGDHRDVEVLQQCVAKLEGLLRRWLDLGQGRTTSLRHLSIYDQVWDPLFQETTRALGVGGAQEGERG